MKKFTFIAILLIGFSLVITQCDKNDDNNSDNNSNNNTSQPAMSGSIDGVAWTAQQMGAQISNGILGIAGTALQQPSITITIKAFTEGTYILNQGSDAVAAVVDGNVAYTTNSDPEAGGTVTITTINKTDSVMSGTFEFKVYGFVGSKGFKEVTNGVFTNIPFTSELPSTPDNSLTVDIDGSAFTPATVNALVVAGKIIISASNTNVTETVGLTIDSDLGPGTYDFGVTSVTGQYNVNNTPMVASSGELTITNHNTTDNVLEGTFYFEASDFIGGGSKSLTNGSFSVNY